MEKRKSIYTIRDIAPPQRDASHVIQKQILSSISDGKVTNKKTLQSRVKILVVDLGTAISGRLKRLVLWWRRMNVTYQWKWRVANGALAVFLLASVALPIAQQLQQSNRYALSSAASNLVGTTDASLVKQLTYDAKSSTYQFNKAAVKTDASGGGLPAALQRASVGASKKSNTKSYALDVPSDFSKGVTYHDTNSGLGFSLVPQFGALNAKTERGHVVFPLDGGNQAIYTLKNNGLKEDIVVPKITQDSMTFSYTLQLPDTLEARIIPGSGGAIGIYSADPSLFGNISYGSSKDQAAVDLARKNGNKTFLVFGLPAPVIKAPNDASVGNATARFVLNGNSLQVVADNLGGLNTAVTIDPSVVITSTSDFQTSGSSEGDIDFSTAGQINRGALTGGGLSAGWVAGTGFSGPRQGMGSVAYNGYIYILGGDSSGARADSYFNTLNAGTGAIGATWTAVTTLPVAEGFPQTVAYNGYMYLMGGVNGSVFTNSVYYVPINSDGTLGATWTATSSFATGRSSFSSAVYNGYLYLMGGYDGTAVHNDVQYAAINPNGTLGTWATTSSFTTARSALAGMTYNGYLYIMAGYNAASTYYADVQYAPLNANGTVGTWKATTSFTTGRAGAAATVYNGYLYLAGGTVDVTNALNDTQYAPINSNGTIGAWKASSVMNLGVFSGAPSAYNGYVYVLGGHQTVSGNLVSSTQYAKIDPVGQASAYSISAGTAFTTTREGLQSVAYNGYLYVLGGDNGSTPVNTIYAATLNADGTVGNYSATNMTAFTTARTFFSAVAANGYMYVLGGCISAFSACTTATNNIATVYQSTISPTNGGLGAWTAQTAFTTGRYGQSAVIYNNFIYVTGGINGSTFQSDIQYHALNASTGAISGAWTTSAKTITAAAYMGATAYGGNLYLGGGCTAGALTCTTRSNSIYYAALASSGDLSAALTTNGTTFTNTRGMFGFGIMNGFMYVTGGWGGGTTYYADVQYAPLNVNGSVGAWVTSTASTLNNTRYAFGSVIANGNIYITGGYNGTTYYTTTQVAQINNGGSGTTPAWSIGATNLNTARSQSSTVAYNGYLYVLGGSTTDSTVTANLNNVEYAPLNADGTVGTWTTDSHLFATVREFAGATAYNGYLYILGGFSGTGAFQFYKDIQFAPIGANGALTGAWASAGANVSNGGDGVGLVTYNGYMYSLGGYDGSTDFNTVQYALICTGSNNGTGGCGATAGKVGTWTSTTSFTNGRSNGAFAVANGYMYLFGGNGTADYNDVQYALINSNGTLGTWAVTTSFNNVRVNTTASAYNGYMYIFGGDTAGNNNYADTLYAPINANGTLGSWQTSFGGLSNSLDSVAGAIYKGFAYIPAGGNAGSATATTQYTQINSIPRVGHYSKQIDLGSLQNLNSVTYNGTVPNGTNAFTYFAYDANGNLVSSGLPSAILAASNTACTGSVSSIRYVRLEVTLDDSQFGSVFGDALGTNNANLTDFTLNYVPGHPQTKSRLRTGQTLQAGGLSTLDTCGYT